MNDLCNFCQKEKAEIKLKINDFIVSQWCGHCFDKFKYDLMYYTKFCSKEAEEKAKKIVSE